MSIPTDADNGVRYRTANGSNTLIMVLLFVLHAGGSGDDGVSEFPTLLQSLGHLIQLLRD